MDRLQRLRMDPPHDEPVILSARLSAGQLVDRALDKLDEARRLVEAAASDLCPVRQLGEEWSRYHHVVVTIERYHRIIAHRREELEARGDLTLDRS